MNNNYDVSLKKINSFPATFASAVFSFVMMAYYLLPTSSFRIVSPGWWLAVAYKPHSPEVCYLATIIYCLSAAIALYIVESKQAVLSRRTSFILPSWLPFLTLVIAAIPTLLLLDHNSDLAPSVCCLCLSYSTGILAAIVTGNAQVSINVLITLATIQSALAIYIRRRFANVIESGTLWRECGTFSSPEALATLASIGAVLALVMFVTVKKPAANIMYGMGFAICIGALTASWSRAGALSLGLAISWYGFRSVAERATKITIIVAAVAFVSFICLTRSSGELNSKSAHQSALNRVLTWSAGTRAFSEHWLTGEGIGTQIIPIAAPTDTSNGKLIAQTTEGPKNSILYIMIQLGIGGLLIVVLSIVCLHRNISFATIENRNQAVAIAAALVAIGVFCLVDSPIGGPLESYGNALFGYLYASALLLGLNRLSLTRPKVNVTE